LFDQRQKWFNLQPLSLHTLLLINVTDVQSYRGIARHFHYYWY
jgi:hypothetical protein